jgi:predicted alpha/beta hydrolase
MLLWKWHVLMPALTAAFGYFPGRKLGWLEDLPAGVAHQWSFRRKRIETAYPREARAEILRRFAAVHAQLLAISVSDDEFGTISAVRRGLSYYTNARRTEVRLTPSDYGLASIGHFSLFHARHRDGFWRDTLRWLGDGINPWPGKTFERGDAR